MPSTVIQHGGDWVPQGMNYSAYRGQGYRFAIRYLVPSIPGKEIYPAEIEAAHKAGIDIAFVYETSGATWTGGYTAGMNDAMAAHNALDQMHAPLSVGVYHAVDTSTAWSDHHTLLAWMQGLQHGMSPYRSGVYGDFDVVELAYQFYPEMFRWQTKAWSGGQVSQHADILQLGQNALAGITFDIDAAYTTYIGQWYADDSRQPPVGIEDKMIGGFIGPGEICGAPFPAGSATRIQFFSDIGLEGGKSQGLRLACHSASKGYSQIDEVNISIAAPVTVIFTEHDVDAVSFKRTPIDGEAQIGFTIS